MAPSGCHGPRADRRAALDRAGPERDPGALARASAWSAQARARGATPVAGRGVQQRGQVTDPSGLTLYLGGPARLKARAAEMNLVEGARCSETVNGTNGVGTALAT